MAHVNGGHSGAQGSQDDDEMSDARHFEGRDGGFGVFPGQRLRADSLSARILASGVPA
jgi:hypothetical protein